MNACSGVRRRRLAVAVCLALSPSAAHAQEGRPEPDPPAAPSALALPGPDELQIVVLAGGSTLIGRIVEIGADEVRFEGDDLDLTIPVADIREVRTVPASSIRSGAHWFENPNQTRLFYAPTARPLPRGTGYVADHLLFFPSVAYGITDQLTLGAGVSLFPGVAWDDQLAFVTPKYGWRIREGFDIAVGALVLALPAEAFESEFGGAGILFSTATWGTPDSSVTAGVGYGYADREWADKPAVVLGGERRISRRIAVVSENWMFPGLEGPLVSLGARFMGERLSVDFAVAHMIGDSEAWLPLVGFVFGFGDR